MTRFYQSLPSNGKVQHNDTIYDFLYLLIWGYDSTKSYRGPAMAFLHDTPLQKCGSRDIFNNLWSSGKLFILIQISVGLRFNASSSPFDFIYQPTRGSVGEIHVRRAIMSIPPNVAGGYWSCFHPLESDFFPFQLPICPKEVRVVF